MGSVEPIFVSHRWVDYCVERNTVVMNPREFKLYHLMPFPHATPYPDLQNMRILVDSKIDFDQANLLKGSIEAMGATKVNHPSEG